MISLSLTIACPTSVAAGAGTYVGNLGAVRTVVLNAVGVGTYQLQGSVNNNDWTNAGAALTADGHVAVQTDTYLYYRWNCTAYTSGTPDSTVIGQSR